MNNFRKFLFFASIFGFLLMAMQCHGQTSPAKESEEEIVDDNDQYVRENPQMAELTKEMAKLEVNYRKYPFIHHKANKIMLNGADWSGLHDLFAHSGDTVINIVHIGDSHLQSDGTTQRVRSLLQERYGSAGRGIVVPYKLAGTNAPSDYTIKSTSSFQSSRLQRKPWNAGMGFTGIALKPKTKDFNFTIQVRQSEGSLPDFDIVKMFCSGDLPKLISAKADGQQVSFTETPMKDTLEIFLHEPAEKLEMRFRSKGDCSIFGFQLENQMTGVEYHSIGNNGASFQSYLSYGKMGKDLQTLHPALVIVSLGSNEAFSDMDDATFYKHLDLTVSDIKQYNPQAQILLTTPGECQRSSIGYSGTGKSRKAVRSYAPNARCETLRDVMLRYGKDNGIPTWDWWDISGGRGCSMRWLESGLLQGDRIHNTWDGYHLQGNLLYEALVKAVENERY